VPDVAREVLRAAAASGFFFSSPDPPPVEGVDLCPALADVGAVALLAGFRTEEPTGGRVGGLDNPPAVVRVADDVAGFAADEVVVVLGRLGAMPRFGRTFSFLTPLVASFGGASFSVSVSISDVTPVVSGSDRTSAGASSW
jgi:hypothetical protein